MPEPSIIERPKKDETIDLRSSSSKTTMKTMTFFKKKIDQLYESNNHYGIPPDAQWKGLIRISMSKRLFANSLEQLHRNVKQTDQNETSILPPFLTFERNLLDEIAKQMKDVDCKRLAKALGLEPVVFEDLKQRYSKNEQSLPKTSIEMRSFKDDFSQPRRSATQTVDEYNLRRLCLYQWFASTCALKSRKSWDELCKALIICGLTDIAYVIGPMGSILQSRILDILKSTHNDDSVVRFFLRRVNQ